MSKAVWTFDLNSGDDISRCIKYTGLTITELEDMLWSNNRMNGYCVVYSDDSIEIKDYNDRVLWKSS